MSGNTNSIPGGAPNFADMQDALRGELRMITDKTDPGSVAQRAARTRLRWLIAVIIVAIFVGGTWDRVWHLSQPFDDFWSLPHLTIYAFSLIAVGIHTTIIMNNRLRPLFGQGYPLTLFGVRLYPMDIPVPLLIIGWGLVTIGFAGMGLDNLWHTHFGLDETGWSAPHAMLGWQMLIIFLGLISAQKVMFVDRPRRWWTTIFWGWVVISFLTGPLMGPVGDARTPETVAAVARIPVFAAQADFQHVSRLIVQWNLTRSNPLLLILAPLWAGAALAFLRQWDRRWWMVLLIVTIWTTFDNGQNTVQYLQQFYPVSDSPANFRELPLWLPTALLLFLIAIRVPEKWAYSAAGLLFSLEIFGIWGSTQSDWGYLILAIPAVLTGRAVGNYIYTFSTGQLPPRLAYRLLLAGITIPIVTGMVDLILRLNTPR